MKLIKDAVALCDLQELIEILPDQSTLYLDSGLWQYYESSEAFLADEGKQQECSESFVEFIRRTVTDLAINEEPDDQGFYSLRADLAIKARTK